MQYLYIYTHAPTPTHIYIYTICVYRYMCTHIYICITTYSIRCFNTLFFLLKKDNGNGEGREKIAIDGTAEKKTGGCFFLGGQPKLWRTLMDCVEKAHPDSLPLGMPLLNPPPSATGAASSYMQNKYPLFS